jgi:cell fate (sporulation/competence/biofilm development) regulator YmcA (YheA/YmcA/DUF963 family)
VVGRKITADDFIQMKLRRKPATFSQVIDRNYSLKQREKWLAQIEQQITIVMIAS